MSILQNPEAGMNYTRSRAGAWAYGVISTLGLSTKDPNGSVLHCTCCAACPGQDFTAGKEKQAYVVIHSTTSRGKGHLTLCCRES